MMTIGMTPLLVIGLMTTVGAIFDATLIGLALGLALVLVATFYADRDPWRHF